MIYFIRNRRRGAVKIGYSDDPGSRLSHLQSASPDFLWLLGLCPGGRAEEAELHRRFAHLHLRGEWFRDEPELLKAAHDLCEAHQLHGRCPCCGAVDKDLREDTSSREPLMSCGICNPSGKTLRRSRETGDATKRIPAGGGYRILRKAFK